MLLIPSTHPCCSMCFFPPSPLLLTSTSSLRWPSFSPMSASCSLPSLCLSGLLGCHGDILGAVVLISAFNNEWKDTIRQSLQNLVDHNAQGHWQWQLSEGMMANTDRCVEGAGCLCTCASRTHTREHQHFCKEKADKNLAKLRMERKEHP